MSEFTFIDHTLTQKPFTMENKVNIHVRQGEFDYTVMLTNNHELNADMEVDFSASQNLKLTPRNYSKQTGPLSVSLCAEAGCQKVIIAVLDIVDRNAGHKFDYKAKMMQKTSHGATEDEDEITKVADGLDLIVRSTENGYKLFGRNTNPTKGYEIVVDLGKSVNLKVVPDPDNAKLLEALVVSATIPANAGFGPIADCPVADMTKGECEIIFGIRARETN